MNLPETTQPQTTQPQTLIRYSVISRGARLIATGCSALALLLTLTPSVSADGGQSKRGSHDRDPRGHRHHLNSHHGYGNQGYGFHGSRAHGASYGSTWGHGYGSFFGGHGFLVSRQDAGRFSGSGYLGHSGRGNHRSHLRSIGHPSRWLYETSYLATYYSSPYFTYQSTSSTAPASPITGYDGTIGSYLGYEPLPVKPKAEIDARPQPASVTLTLEPGDASIYLDGNFLGVASELTQSLLVAPGSHRLEVARPGYDTLQLELDVTAGETLEIQRSLTAAN